VKLKHPVASLCVYLIQGDSGVKVNILEGDNVGQCGDTSSY